MNPKKPIIAIVCNQDFPEKPEDVKTNDVNQRYTTAILNAGGLPVLIPVEFPVSEIAVLRTMADGIFLVGGEDVAIDQFGGKPHPSVSVPNPERDALEIALTRLAIQTDWPILGICRGVQSMNVAMGGTLYTDIADQFSTPIIHNSPEGTPRDAVIHPVRLQPDSQAGTIFAEREIPVNSFHHQAIKDLAPGFTASGFSPDGLIETVEFPKNRFAVGVQWHPECMQESPVQIRLFTAFVEKAGN